MIPWKYAQESGYQLVHSLYAIGSGGFWGLGIGKSREKLFYLPDSHTDFIFSILSEELGFLGVITVISLFAILIIRGLIISIRAQDNFGAYLAMGLTALIGLQAAINMAVVSGLMPTKGVVAAFPELRGLLSAGQYDRRRHPAQYQLPDPKPTTEESFRRENKS